MADDFDDPRGGGDMFPMKDYEGRLCLFTPTEYIPTEKDAQGNVIGGGVKTANFGRKDCVVTDIVVLAESKGQKDEVFSGVLIFAGKLIGTLKGKVDTGRRVLGVLGKGENEKGNPPWILTVASDAQKQVARDYRASVPEEEEDPFAV